MTLALFATAAAAGAMLLLRRRARVRFFSVAAGLWIAAIYLAPALKPLGIEIDGRLAFIACSVLMSAALWIIVACSPAVDVRWSASRAALAAFLFYLATIPMMLRTPPDGDEPFYILVTESMIFDRDLDLANQYRDLASSAARRSDLRPQLGDPAGKHGEIYSRHEPFLSALLIPGYLLGGLPGVLATMAVFGALLARSTIRLFEEEGIDDATTRALYPLFALGPPILFYSVRVWPEVPAAFFLVETVRGIRARRPTRWLPSIAALVLLKLRFLLIAVVLLVRAVRRPRHLAIGSAIVAAPLLIVRLSSGSATNVHDLRELLPGGATAMLKGLFGLALDGAAGIAFQAPIYLFGLIALGRWLKMPAGFRLGMSAAAIYIFYLVPRAEWHGGWSPPLRYIVVFMPFLALGCASLWHRIHGGAIAVATAWTIALVVHGLTFPWRLFQIANGENFVGEALSSIWHSDFSRLFPSFIRPNMAAGVAAVLLVIAMIFFRNGRLMSPSIVAIALAGGFVAGRRPASNVEFEDAHVEHQGGDLFPQTFQVQRFLYQGGWTLRAGDSMSFLARGGKSILGYQAAEAATVQVGTRAYVLPATAKGYAFAEVDVEGDGRTEVRCLSGEVNLDRMEHVDR